jgi:hypothetical protein
MSFPDPPRGISAGSFAVMVEAACLAHWPSFPNMRPDHARKWRLKMAAALVAALDAQMDSKPLDLTGWGPMAKARA